MGSLRRVMDTHPGRGRQRTLSYPRRIRGLRPVAVGRGHCEQTSSPAEAPPAAEGSLALRSIRVPGHSRQRVKLLPASSIRGSEGCAASRVVISTRSRITIIRCAVRFRAPSGTVRWSRLPWYCIVQAHLVRRLVARPTGPERQSTAAYRTPRTPPRRRPLPVEQPAMPSAPKWTRRNRHLRLQHGVRPIVSRPFRRVPVGTCRPPCRGSSALASRALSA